MSTAVAPNRTGQVLADLLPVSRVREVALVVGGAALTGLAAQIAVPVPGSPVPVTGQTFAALLVGTTLGVSRGMSALVLYALAGLAGVPWFSNGTSGVSVAFGYIVGMILASAAVGALARRGADRSTLRIGRHDAGGRGDHLRSRRALPRLRGRPLRVRRDRRLPPRS